MLIRINKNMIKLLEKAKIKKEEIIKINTDNLAKIMIPNFKEVHDCIIIENNNEINVENVNVNTLKMNQEHILVLIEELEKQSLMDEVIIWP